MRLLCLGDIALSDQNLTNLSWPPPNGFTPDEDSRILLNWELPIGRELFPIPRENDAPRILSFPSSPSLIQQWAPGFAALATNHILDAGDNGLVETINSLNNQGFITVGAGLTQEEISKPIIWETNEGKLAIINWVFPETHPEWLKIPGPNCWPGIEAAANLIGSLKSEADWVMVLSHWSDEFFPYPRPEDRETAQKLINAGMDLMISHHPHVVRGYEIIDSCPIFYSIGNFFFSNYGSGTSNRDINWAPRNREALGVQIVFARGQIPEISTISFWQGLYETNRDNKNRAVKRLRGTSKPLIKYRGQEYSKWYAARRKGFFELEAKWHFGVRKRGIWGTIQYFLEKISSSISN